MPLRKGAKGVPEALPRSAMKMGDAPLDDEDLDSPHLGLTSQGRKRGLDLVLHGFWMVLALLLAIFNGFWEVFMAKVQLPDFASRPGTRDALFLLASS